jgi:serine/threonine protein kinase
MILETLRSWICERFPRYSCAKEIAGPYGLVLVMEATEANVSPRKFCVTTINPAKFSPGVRDLKALFHHEMRLWLNVPFHYCVLPALGLEFGPPPKEIANQFDVLPLVRMPFCEASLSTWVSDLGVALPADRLIALAQVCSGLQWLYDHGIEGHGDLKPDNILIRDLRETFALGDGGFPSTRHPWHARVADLGWADIWRQGRGTYHAWRPYLAPERFHNAVVPRASDMYALGVIACELLSGTHPAGEKTESLAKKWNQKKWKKWAGSATRELNIEPLQLRGLVFRCLDPEPSNRPNPADLRAALCEVLQTQYDLPIAQQLQAEDQQARALPSVSHQPWAAEELSRIDTDQLDCSIAQLESTLAGISDRSSMGKAAAWLTASRSLQRLLLRRNQAQDDLRVVSLAKATLDFIFYRAKDLDLRSKLYGEFLIKDLRPEEVSFEFAAEAFANLKQATGEEDAPLKAYRAQLDELGQAAYGFAWRRES